MPPPNASTAEPPPPAVEAPAARPAWGSPEDLLALKPDAASPTPLYLQIALRLRETITAGRWPESHGLPSERQLVDSLSVSRVTARKAIQQLTEWGLVVRRQGLGTFVAPRLTQPLSRLSSFSEELKLRGLAAGSIWLERAIGLPTPEEMMALGLSSGDSVARLRRLRTADGVVMGIEHCRIPTRILPDPQHIEGSLYGYLDAANTPVVRALQRMSATNATAEQARLLSIQDNAAVLFITRLGYGRDNQIIELTHSYCRPDYYEFVAELTRNVE